MAARPPRVLISNSCNNNEKENENMAKKSTKFIALLLTVLMVITLLPMSVLAEDAETWGITNAGGTSYYKADGTSGSSSSYDVSVSKDVEKTATENQFKVTVNVKYKTTTTTTTSKDAATCLVIDASGSMGCCAECGGEDTHVKSCKYYIRNNNKVTDAQTRISAAEQGAKNFLEGYAKDSSGNFYTAARWVSIVAFDSYVGAANFGTNSKPVYWINVNNAANLKIAEDLINFSYGGGTNTGEAMKDAAYLFTTDATVSSISNKFCVLLTDGEPTAGGGFMDNPTDYATTQSQALANVADLYTIAYGLSDAKIDYNGKNKLITTWMKDDCGATAVFPANSADDVATAFAKILADTADTGTSSSAFSDSAAASITGVTGNVTDFSSWDNQNNASIDESGNITWDFSGATEDAAPPAGYKSYTMSYFITLNTTASGFVTGTVYNIGAASLTYIDSSTKESHTVSSPSPSVWGTVPNYTISWDTNGDGTVDDTTTVAYGAVPTHANGSKTADAQYTYTFTGWDPEVVAVTGDATYTAQFSTTTNNYTISWDTNGDGTVDDTTTVAYGAVPTHANGSKTADAQYTYTFTGWDPEVVAVTGDATYTAQFSTTTNNYTISWDTNGDGTVDDTTTVAYGAVPTHANGSKTADAQYTYTFTGWDPEVVAVTGDATYTAQFSTTTNNYTISWDTNGDGTVDDTTTVAYGAVPTHANGSKTADAQYTYTFTGWDPEVVAVTGDATYTAQFSTTTNNYTISWDTNGDGTVDDTTTEAYGAVPTHANGSKTADAQYTYTFTGWDPEVVAVTGDATYTAQFSTTTNNYTISWDTNGDGTVDDTTTVAYGAVPTHANGSKTADAQYTYTFTGWDPEVVAVTGDATYTAQFSTTTNNYTISWDTNGDGTVDDTTTVAYGAVPTHANGSKTADAQYTYTFTGWDPEVVAVTGDATYTAQFSTTTNNYTISWDTNGDGTVDDTTTEAYGAVPTHANGSKTADAQYTYTFTGWDPEVVAVTGDATYTAQFSTTTNNYTISWDTNGDGTVDDTTTVAYGAVPTHANGSKTADAQYTYTFTGWDPEVVAVTGDATYTAQFSTTTNNYTISWDTNGDGTVDDTTTVAYGAVPTHANGSKTADAQYTYTFTGWDPEVVAVTGDATYTAQFSTTTNNYTISWDTNGDGTVDDTTTVAYGAVPTHANGSKTADAQYTYTFTGWDPEVVAVTGDATYTAQFSTTTNNYTISWDTNGDGTVDDTTTEAYGAVPTHANGSKTADAQYTYTFTGWDPEVVAVTGDATYTAQFSTTTNNYTISWDTNGDGTVDDTTTEAYGAVPTHADGSKTADAQYTYTFTGWDPEVVAVTGDATYTAQFDSIYIDYTVTYYDENGTTQLGTGTYNYGSPVTAPEDPTKAADSTYTYAFAGWTLVSGTALDNGTCAGNATYKATYTPTYINYTVTYVLNGGKSDATLVYNGLHYGDATPTIANPTRSGSTFKGWSPAVAETVTGNATYTAQWKSSTVIVIPPDTPTTDIPEEPVPEALNSTDHFVYVVGYPDGNVKPGGNITRAEVTTMFYRLLTADSRDAIFTSVASFSDMNASLWYNKAVASMAKGNYVTGYPNGTFGGNKKITRAEFVAIAARFMDAKDGTVTFTDVSSSNWAYQYIATAVSYGWITGYADGTFKPNQYITRAEAITIINRMLNRGVDAAGLIEGFKAWPDNISGQWYYYDVIEATNDHEYTGARPSEVWSSLTTTYSYDIVKYEHP
jgi:hypothetical protein